MTARLMLMVLFGTAMGVMAQQAPPRTAPPPSRLPARPLPAEPVTVDTAEGGRVRAVVVARGMPHPWGLAFLPDGTMLVTERAGRLRVVRDGRLEPLPVAGVPEVFTRGRFAGLMDVAADPQFAQNRFVYLTYSKPVNKGSTVALARGRLDGTALTDVSDVFVADAWSAGGAAGSRIAFGPDGMLYLTVGGSFNISPGVQGTQDPGNHLGKVLRLTPDGKAPPDNPFVGRPGHKPEIYSMGHRNQLGLAFRPGTGELWAHENAPQGGDELNVIKPGLNYGWPLVSYARDYSGPRIAARPWQEGMEQPAVVWLPSIAPSGMVFYTGDRFPAWKGNLFVGAMVTGRIQGTGHLERLVFTPAGEELRRESLFGELRQRIRDVRQGPDGFLYLLTDEEDGALLRLEPAN